MQKLRDVMSTDVTVISPDATLQEAARQMRSGDFGLLPVGENDRMIGTISDRDIVIRGVAAGKDVTTPVRQVMSDGIFWAREDDSIEDAARMMSEHQIRRLPVVDANKRLVGIVSLGDVALDSLYQQPAAVALSAISKPSGLN